MKHLLMILGLTTTLHASATVPPAQFYKLMAGVMTAPAGDIGVTLNLYRLGPKLGGSYYYNQRGGLIDLCGTIDDVGQVRLRESVRDSETGFFLGRFTAPDEFQGVWHNSDSSTSLPFRFREDYPTGSARCVMNRFQRTLGGGKDITYSVSYAYPGLDRFPQPAVQEAINSRLATGKDPGDLEISTAEDYARMKEEYRDDPAAAQYYTPEWAVDEVTRVVGNGSYLLSLETYHYEYTGGAHPNTAYTLTSYDLRTGLRITLADLIADRERFDRIAEEIFRADRGLGPSDDLDSAGFWFPDGRFAVNDNYLFTPAGVRFIYNPYEITNYAAGPIELIVPYKRIAVLLKKDHPLRDWLR